MSYRWPEASPILEQDFATPEEWFTDQQVLLEEFGGWLDRENLKHDKVTPAKLQEGAVNVYHDLLYGYDDSTFQDLNVRGIVTVASDAILTFVTLGSFIEIDLGVSFQINSGGGADPVDARHVMGMGVWLDGRLYEMDGHDQREGQHSLDVHLLVPVLAGTHRIGVGFWVKAQDPGVNLHAFGVRVVGVTISAVEMKR